MHKKGKNPLALPTQFDFSIAEKLPRPIGKFNPLHYSLVNDKKCFLTTILVTFYGRAQFYRINWQKFIVSRKPNFSLYSFSEFMECYEPINPIVLPPYHKWVRILDVKNHPRIWAAQFHYKI